MPCIIPSKRVVICVSKVENHLKFLDDNNNNKKRLTTDTSSGISLKGSPERSLTYGGTISVKILCCVRKQKRVNLQCIKYLLNATCHSVFSHTQTQKIQ